MTQSATAPVTQLSTISNPATEAASETAGAAPPVPDTPISEVASVAADKPVAAAEPDKSLEVSRRFEVLAKREAKARRIETEATQKAEALAAQEAKIAEKLAALESALEDPIDYYMKLGKDPVEIAQRFAKPVTAEEKRIAKIEAELAARDERDKKRAEEWENEQRETKKQHAVKTFVSSIIPDECPHLTTLYDAHEVPALVSELLNRVDPEARDESGRPDRRTLLERFSADHGRNPSDSEIRDCLEHEAQLRATKILKARERAAQPAPAPSQQDPEKGSGPSTIGNQHGSAAAAPKRRPLSLEDRRKATRDQLVRDLEAEAASRKSD